jgi:hypothetical protein
MIVVLLHLESNLMNLDVGENMNSILGVRSFLFFQRSCEHLHYILYHDYQLSLLLE